MAQPILFTSNIFAGYGEQIVLFDMSFEIQSAEWVLFIGPNGSGKSTFLKVIGGLISPQKGKIVFNLPGIGSKDKKKNGIGFLKQTNNIFPALTVMENLELASFYSDNHELNNFLELLFATFPDLKEKDNKRAGLLSGGMRQKLAIGMVLARKHKLLLLDEPTAGLAPHAASEILDKIEILKDELSKIEPLTIIMVEHNYRYVKDKVTRLIGMREGEIVIDSDSPMNILDNKDQMEKIFFG